MGKKKKQARDTAGHQAIPDHAPLPSPDQLVLREDMVKITLSLSRRSVEFFKQEAGKNHLPYQRMIRALIDAYTERALSGRRDG